MTSGAELLRLKYPNFRIDEVPNGTSCVVYCAINLVNSKIYVGATEKGLDVRKRKHLANAKRGQSGKFYTSIRKYGTVSFEFVSVRSCGGFWQALEIERQVIAELKPEYNLTEGGGGVKGLKFSEESRKKMSDAKIGKPCLWVLGPNADETKRKLSVSGSLRKGTYNLTADQKGKLLINSRKANAARRRAVRCDTDGRVFESVSEAAIVYGVSNSHIANWTGRCKSRLGLRFSYVDKLQ